MEFQVLEGDGGEVVKHEGVDERETMLFCLGEGRVGEDGGLEVSLWEVDTGEVYLEFIRAVSRPVLGGYWDCGKERLGFDMSCHCSFLTRKWKRLGEEGEKNVQTFYLAKTAPNASMRTR